MRSQRTPGRRRSLSQADTSLWKAYIRDVIPIRAERPAERTEADPAGSAIPPKTAGHKPARASYIKADPSRSSRLKPLDVGQISDIDRSTARKFTTGRLPIEDRLDLHGLNQEQAHTRLNRFIEQAHGRAVRCVLVITGKGHGVGVLKRQVPVWLNMPRLRPHILAFSPARRHDGGEGALYVLIRRKRG